MSAFLFGVPGALKTLKDRVTATRAGWFDRLQYVTSTRMIKMDYITSARMSALDNVTLARMQELDRMGSVGVRDIHHMPLCGVKELRLKDDGASIQDANNTGDSFWSDLAQYGAQGSLSAVNTWATLVNLSSTSGWLFNVISPAGYYLGSTQLDLKITLDGTEYNSTATLNNGSASRLILGPVWPGNPGTGGYGVQPGASAAENFSSPKYDSLTFQDHGFLLDPVVLWSMRTPMLRFDSSLKIEARTSNYQTANNEHKFGATYMIDRWT